MSRKRLALISGCFLSLCLTGGVWAGLIASVGIGNLGTVKGVGLTADPDTLNWGKLSPNDSKTLTVLLTSTSNIAIRLNMTVSGLPSYLSLTWNREAYQLAPGQSVDASFTLTASNAPQGTSFSFDIIVTGMEA